jgi:signal peptide peptidase SppA
VKYAHLVAEFYSRAWAIRPEKLYLIDQLIRMRAAGQRFTDEEIRERIGADAFAGPRPRATTPGTIAIIPIMGVISHRMNMVQQISGPGGTSIQKLTAQFRAALDDSSVKAIIFDVDSPGGSVDGVPELAAEIFDARSQKKIVAVANTMAASAAYWLASAADELVVTPSGSVGSIGVYAAHEDVSKAMEMAGINLTLVSYGKYKTEGNPWAPLSEEAKAEMQSKVDAYGEMFIKAVAKNRGTDPQTVRGGFGQGRLALATEAVKQKMADRVATLDDVLAKYGVNRTSQFSGASASAVAGPLPADDDPDDPIENDDQCKCSCSSCQGCTTKSSAKADSDGMDQCRCSCDSCKGCAMKAKAHAQIARRRRELDLY